jgi:serine/threonine protein kinase
VSYCINPSCENRLNPDEFTECQACNTHLLVHGRLRLIKPLREFDTRHKTEIFEVEDLGTDYEQFPTHRVLKVYIYSDADSISWFEREVEVLTLLSSLNNQGIPRSTIDDYFTVLTSDNETELRCIVMQKFEGQNLQEWVELNGSISQNLALNWLQQLGEILGQVHEAGFIHRDIKPSNIILRNDGKLALIDFATAREMTLDYLARIGGSIGRNSSLGRRLDITAIASGMYTPQEQIDGLAIPASDFFALGRTFVYLVTGTNIADLIDPQTGKLQWRAKARQIRKPLQDFIDRLMVSAPGKRPENAQNILDFLESHFKLKFFLKLNRIMRSRPFKIGLCFLVTLALPGLYQGAKVADAWYQEKQTSEQANQELEQAKEFFSEGLKHQLAKELWPARTAYEHTLQLDPHHQDALNNLARVCEQLNDEKCVVDSYEQLLKVNPKSGIGHYNLGSFWDEQGKWDKAEAEYNLAISSNTPISIDALSKLSRLKNRMGQYDEAIFYANQGRTMLKQQYPKDTTSEATQLKNLGWAAYGKKQYVEAQKKLEEALKLDATRTDAMCLLAQVYEAQSQWQKANTTWGKCASMDSQLPEVRDWRLQKFDSLLLRD